MCWLTVEEYRSVRGRAWEGGVEGRRRLDYSQNLMFETGREVRRTTKFAVIYLRDLTVNNDNYKHK